MANETEYYITHNSQFEPCSNRTLLKGSGQHCSHGLFVALYAIDFLFRKPKSPSKVCRTGLTNNQDFDLHYSVGSRNQLTTVLKFFFLLLYYEESNSISVSESVFPRVETTFPTVQFTSADGSGTFFQFAKRDVSVISASPRSGGLIIVFSLFAESERGRLRQTGEERKPSKEMKPGE